MIVFGGVIRAVFIAVSLVAKSCDSVGERAVVFVIFIVDGSDLAIPEGVKSSNLVA